MAPPAALLPHGADVAWLKHVEETMRSWHYHLNYNTECSCQSPTHTPHNSNVMPASDVSSALCGATSKRGSGVSSAPCGSTTKLHYYRTIKLILNHFYISNLYIVKQSSQTFGHRN